MTKSVVGRLQTGYRRKTQGRQQRRFQADGGRGHIRHRRKVGKLGHHQSGMTTGIDAPERLKVHVHIQRQAVIAGTASDADADAGELGVRDLVTALEQSVIRYAGQLGIAAAARREAPGVYVAGAKLASVGIRIRRGASYHGLALNVNMDLEPFQRINPCGQAGLLMTQLADLAPVPDVATAASGLEPALLAALGFAHVTRL